MSVQSTGEMRKGFCPNFLQHRENIDRWSCNGGSRELIPVFHNPHRKCRPSPSAVARILDIKFSRRPGLKDHQVDCFIKPGEPAEDKIALHAGLSITETHCHLQSHWYQTSVHSKNYRTHTFTHYFCSQFKPQYGLFGQIIPSRSLHTHIAQRQI